MSGFKASGQHSLTGLRCLIVDSSIMAVMTCDPFLQVLCGTSCIGTISNKGRSLVVYVGRGTDI